MNDNYQYNDNNYDQNLDDNNYNYDLNLNEYLLLFLTISSLCALNYCNNLYKQKKNMTKKLNQLLINNNECSICLDKINLENAVILNCEHYFHKECLKIWFNKSKTCPICRNEMI